MGWLGWVGLETIRSSASAMLSSALFKHSPWISLIGGISGYTLIASNIFSLIFSFTFLLCLPSAEHHLLLCLDLDVFLSPGFHPLDLPSCDIPRESWHIGLTRADLLLVTRVELLFVGFGFWVYGYGTTTAYLRGVELRQMIYNHHQWVKWLIIIIINAQCALWVVCFPSNRTTTYICLFLFG